MATVSQLKIQLGASVKYTGGEAILPQPPLPEPPPMMSIPEVLEEGTDLGVVKVENGKLVIDMAEFNPDFGTYQ